MGITGIGYEGVTIDTFVSRLRVRGIKTLVDVRLNAISRKKGFSKRALAEALAESGIDYVHMPALGNQRDNRSGYGELHSPAAQEARTRFSAALGSVEAISALDKLAELARAGGLAVFCYEQDERHCHREQVIERVTRLLESDLVDA